MLEAGETKPCPVCGIELHHDEKKKEVVEGGFPKLSPTEAGGQMNDKLREALEKIIAESCPDRWEEHDEQLGYSQLDDKTPRDVHKHGFETGVWWCAWIARAARKDGGGVLGARTVERSVEPGTHGGASTDREARPLDVRDKGKTDG